MMNYPEIKPLTGKANFLITLVHGLGSNGDDLIDIIPYVQHILPNCHFISPHGIEAYDMAPVGRQWFSLRNRETNVLRPLIDKSSIELEKIIKLKQEELKLDNSQTILVGFSQGTMLSLYLTLNSTNPFLACVGFSGCLIPPDRCRNKKTPICLVHGKEDDIVTIDKYYLAKQYLEQENIEHKAYEIDNLRHSINNHALNYGVDFIRSQINMKEEKF